MIQMGFTGVHDTFIGDGNFLVAYADNPNPEELISELGIRYEVMSTNIKKFCVGFPIQSPTEGLLLLIDRHNLRPDEVKSIEVRLPVRGAHTVNDREMPDINLQYIFAVALIDRKVSFAAAHSFERMSDPKILDLRSKITLVGDQQLTDARPEWQSIVQVETNDGRTLKEHVVTFKGKAENPLTTAEVVDKAADLMEPVLGKRQSEELIDAINRLDKLDSVRSLRPLLTLTD
jgi:2-methylcitrate dehydratase PrpD